AHKAETEALVKREFEKLPDVVKGAIERAQAKANLPGRVPMTSGAAPENTNGAVWQTEDEQTAARLRLGFDLGDHPPVAIGGGKQRKMALLREFYNYSPAAKHYAGQVGEFKGMGDYLKSVYGTKMGSGFKGV